MNYKILLIALIIGGYIACEDLERKNPVDPNINITAPTNLQLSQQNIHTVLLSWNFNGDKYDGFMIDRKIGSDSWQIAYDTVACEIHSYTDTSAVPTESHTYRIYAFADENQSSSISKDITLVFPAPENLQLTQLSDTTVALQWQDKSDGEDGFVINRKKDSGAWETEIKKTTATTWTDSTVSPGSAYSYQVKAYRGIKTSTTVESQYQNIFQAPSNLSATAIDDQSLRLNWTDNCGFESGYRVERNDGSGFIQITELNANITTYKDEGLTYGQSYSYRVKTHTSQNESDYSNEIQAETVFPAPSFLSAEAIDDQSIQLTWTDNCVFELGYRIECNDGNGFVQISEVSVDVTIYTDEDLTYGQNYFYRVKAFTDKNESEYSNESSSVKMIIPAPTTLTATQIDDQSLRLNWTDSCGFESGYRIERNDGSGFVQVSELDADITSFTDEGLTYGQSYSYRVKAFTTNNESGYSNLSNSIEMIILAPTNLSATAIDDQSSRLSWTDNCNFEVGFRIERNDGGGFIQVGEVSADVTTYIDVALIYGQSYTYRVKAFINRNESDYSNELQTETVFPVPTNLTANVINDQTIELTWEDNCTFETGYKVERKEESGAFTEITDLDANAEDYTDEGLTFGVIYTYRIQAYTNSNLSEYSEEVITNMNVVVDIDGNFYAVVKIGDQWWMAENLKVIHYRNGDAIPNVTLREWSALTTGAYCDWGNDPNNAGIYGRLYNWYTVADSRKIAPEGWHVSSDEEWQTLVDYLGGSSVAGGKMKETGTEHWDSPNAGATNESGFSALPGGGRNQNNDFSGMGYYAWFWSSTEHDSNLAWYRELMQLNSTISRPADNKRRGFSVRCVRD